MWLCRLLPLLPMIFAFGVTSGRAAEKRLALVVGVGAYAHLPNLGNSVADAKLVADRLRADGFDVDFIGDPTRDGLGRAVRDFGRRLADAGGDAVALFYYAGHGVQDEKQVNYLIGADANVRSQIDLPIEGLRLDSVLGTIEEARPRISFAVIDACRDNPLPLSSSRGAPRGLAVEGELRGVLIAFSTEPGKTADDGPTGQNSPFAVAFAHELEIPGLEAANLFRDVSRRVLDATNQEQFPWITQRLTEDFYFKPAVQQPASASSPAVPSGPLPTAAQVARPPAPDLTDGGEIDYGQAVLANTAVDYADWLRRYPDHPRRKSVIALLQRLNEQTLWDRAETSDNLGQKRAALQRLVLAFPDGAYAEAAKVELDKMAGALPSRQAPTNDRAPSDITPQQQRLAEATVNGLDPNGDNFLALKSAPDVRSARITTMGPGTVLSVLGHSGLWTRVRLRDGQTGWAFSRYLVEAQAPATATQAPAGDDHAPLAVVEWHDAHAVHTYSDRLQQFDFFYCRGPDRRRLMAIQLPIADVTRSEGETLVAIARQDTFETTDANGREAPLHPVRRFARTYTDNGQFKAEIVLQLGGADWSLVRNAVRIWPVGRESSNNALQAARLTVPLFGDHEVFTQIDADCMK